MLPRARLAIAVLVECRDDRWLGLIVVGRVARLGLLRRRTCDPCAIQAGREEGMFQFHGLI